MVARLGIMGVLVAGCLTAEVPTPCGDVVCAGDAECRGEGADARCVPGGLLRACEGRDEATPCTFGGTDGTCRTGECVPVRCGNGIVDGDDECDGGPGCSSTCRAIACGNGRIDPGEQCDCGDASFAGARPDECDGVANADDAGAYCRADCGRLVFCGNGFVEAGEVCDPADAGGGPCSPLCDSDLSCGNGVPDFAAGEACDCGTDGAALPAGCTQANGAGPDACRTDCALPTCGDGIVDAGEVCDDAGATGAEDTCNAQCTSDLSCGNGVLDPGEECDADVAACQLANCTLRRCGNGVTEPELGEVCDDGGNAAGDGCSADCRSDETCGNGRLDFALGLIDEACDDGNQVSHDGCSSACASEVATWLPRVSGQPAGRRDAAAAFDAARGRVVVHGGLPDVGTWEWTGGSWAQAPTTAVPPTRRQHAMAYDAERHRVVLFGGVNVDGLLDDTWTWDGEAWREVIVVGERPPKRHSHAMAFHAGRKRVVMFGGTGVAHHLGDLWSFDGTGWTLEQSDDLAPLPRASPGMAYAPWLDEVIVFGGYIAGVAQNDLRAWDGTSWRVLDPGGAASATRPAARRSPLGVDLRRQELVLFSGYDGAPDDTWIYDDAGWSQVATAPGETPPKRSGHTLTYDLARDQLVLVGGVDGSTPRNDTWTWDGALRRWTQRTMQTPGPREGAGLAWDPLTGRTLLAAGITFDVGYRADTWGWDHDAWRLLEATGPLASFSDVQMVYVPARGAVHASGGFSGVRTGAEWDGTTWVGVSVGTPQAVGAPMCVDATTGEAIVYGGAVSDSELVDEVAHLQPAGWDAYGPLMLARRDHACATDPLTGRVLLFGGEFVDPMFPFEFLRDTWLLSSSLIGEPAPISSTLAPSARARAAATLDPARRQVVLFGGDGAPADTWAFAGTQWSPVSVSDRAPPPMARHDLAYDGRGQHTVLFAPDGTTWTLAWTSGVADEACGSGVDYDHDGLIGCADPDCWGVCAPTCDPHTFAAGACATDEPRCGDGACGLAEDCRLCPSDCGACAAVCGDGFCESPEDDTTCPGDCP
ncbi:MAG: kelch repeat-containing protein [Kofleriaceae bacterium]